MIEAVIFDVDGTLVDSVDLHAKAWRDTFAEDGATIEKRHGQILKERYLDQVHGFSNVRQLFERLQGDGIQTVLASSAKADELEFYKRRAGIDDLIEKETSSDDVEKSKPHADIFEAAVNRIKGHVERSRMIVIGDTPYDAEAAVKAGLRTIGVLCGGFAETDLRQAGCYAVYRDPTDLLRNYETLVRS